MRIFFSSVISLLLVLWVEAKELDSFQQCSCENSSNFQCYCMQFETCITLGIADDSSLLKNRLKSRSHECLKDEVCCENLPVHKKTNQPSETLQQSVCGQRGPSPLQSGEKDTGRGEFPWMLAIYKIEEDEWKFQCGATLIGRHIGLTAGHCVDRFKDSPGELKVTAGLWDLKDKEFQQSSVKEVVLHPQYSRDPARNDIALVITRKNFQYREDVGTVCIPPKSLVFPPGTKCFATGWGRDSNDPNSTMNTQLKKVELTILSHQTCQRRLRRTFLGRYFRLHNSFLCAGGEKGKDTCKGDGGSPLVCHHKGKYFQTGIVSWGISCGVKYLPGVYANITLFSDWLMTTQNLYP